MNSYFYVARDPGGALVRGVLQSPNESMAISKLRAADLCVSLLTVASVPVAKLVLQPSGTRTRRDAAVCIRTLATLFRSGITLSRSLDICQEQCTSIYLRNVLGRIASAVKSGTALGDAARAEQGIFDHWACAMLDAGELSGNLEAVLGRLASSMERDIALRRRLTSSLVYPAAVAMAAFALIVFLLVSVVPMFDDFYAQLHGVIPPFTRLLLKMSAMMRSPFPLFASGVAAIAGAFVVALLRRRIDSILLLTPLIGSVIRKACSAKVARIAGMLLEAGVAAPTAIEVAYKALSNSVFQGDGARVGRSIEVGESLSAALTGGGFFEPMFVHMVRAGEETGTLDEMLSRVADHYDAELESALAIAASAVEPALILFLGGIVAFIVAALFVPLYSLIGNIK